MDLKSNQEYTNYIETVCSQIKGREVKDEVTLELKHHIQDIAAEYLEEGMTESEAVAKAISRMGSAEVVGKELNKVHKPRPDWGIVTLTFVLVIAGLFIAYCLDLDTSVQGYPDLFSTKVAFSVLGIALAAGLYFFDYRKIQPYSLYLYFAAVLALFFIPLLFNYSGFARVVAEISLLLLVISLAGMFQHWKWEQPKYYILGLGVFSLPLCLLFVRSSLAVALSLSVVLLILMYLSRAKAWQIILTAGLAGPGTLLMIGISAPYQINRLLALLNPGLDSTGYGWLALQAETLRNSAGIFGQGINSDTLLLPNLQGEFVLNYIIYTFGWLAAIVLIISVAVFIFRLVGIGLKVKNSYGKFLTTGIATILGFRFLWNILMNLGILPIAGLNFPLISSGGLDFLINMVMIGLILSIYRRRTLTSRIESI